MSDQALMTSDRYRALAKKCRLSVALNMNTVFDPVAGEALAEALDGMAEVSEAMVNIGPTLRIAFEVLLSSPVPPRVATP